MRVESTPAASLTINAQGGSNTYVIDMSSLGGSVAINDTTGASQLTVNAPSNAGSETSTLSLSPTGISSSAGGAIQFNLGSTTLAGLTVVGASDGNTQLILEGTPPSPLTLENAVVVNAPPTDLGLTVSPSTISEAGRTAISGSFADPNTQDLHSVTVDWGDELGPHDAEPGGGGHGDSRHRTHVCRQPAQRRAVHDSCERDGRQRRQRRGRTEVTVANVAPTADLSNNGPITYGGTATLGFTGVFDPSAVDTAAGFHFAYATSLDGFAGVTYNSGSTADSWHDFTGLSASDHTLYGRIIDKDGGFTQYSTVVHVDHKAASVTPNPASKTVRRPRPGAGRHTQRLPGGGQCNGKLQPHVGEAVGAYTVSATLSPIGVLGNYVVTYDAADFTIGQRAVEVTADAKCKTYGDTDPRLTYQITTGAWSTATRSAAA